MCHLEVESLRYSYFCLHVQPLLKVFLGVRDPRSKQMCDELSCKHLFVEFLYSIVLADCIEIGRVTLETPLIVLSE